jgi:hypothetical protein
VRRSLEKSRRQRQTVAERLQEIQRMSPGIKAREELVKKAGIGATAVAGQATNDLFEVDLEQLYKSVRRRQPRTVDD